MNHYPCISPLEFSPGHRSAFEGAISDAQSVEFLQDLALEEGATTLTTGVRCDFHRDFFGDENSVFPLGGDWNHGILNDFRFSWEFQHPN